MSIRNVSFLRKFLNFIKMNPPAQCDSKLDSIRKKPFIVICGCTGTGKTKLSIQLAEWLINMGKKSEIINADAMQVKIKGPK